MIEERAARLLEQLRGRTCAGEVAEEAPAREPYDFTQEEVSSMLADKHPHAERERTAAAERETAAAAAEERGTAAEQRLWEEMKRSAAAATRWRPGRRT